MKNEKHPIDNLFQRGLNQHAVPSPMHILERIEESRGRRHRGKLVFLRQRFTIVSSAAAVLLLGVWLGWSDTPELGSFPLISGSRPMAANLPTNTDGVLELPTQQAGILPDVSAIINKNKSTKNNKPAILVATPAKSTIGATATTIKGITEPEPSTTSEEEKREEVKEDPALLFEDKASPATLASLIPAGAISLGSVPSYLNKLDAVPMLMPETGCARFSEGRPAIFLAVAAGPSFANRQFNSKSSEFTDYAQQRTDTETPRLSYGANARLSVVFPWGGAIRSGVGYTQINEQLVYRNSKVRQTTITDIYGPNGEVIGSDTSYITENTILKYSNKHRLIDIPFQLGYEVRYNKVTLAANAGMNINIAYASEGNYLGPRDLLPTRFDNNDDSLEPVYKTEIGLSWQASLGLHYQLNDRLDLMAEPYLRYYPESFTQGDYPLDQKYLLGGVGVGLRVLL